MDQNEIAPYITQIQKAIHGRDVRGSIILALEKCYEDATDTDLTNEEKAALIALLD